MHLPLKNPGLKDHKIGFSVRLPSATILARVALLFIVLLAIGLRFANLSALGEVNHYYTAAVKSMLQSWHNFFYAAAEPGGSVSVDKTPVGLWLMTASAAVFGVNTLGILLPQLVAGILAVILVYYLVKRQFGEAAGLLAALALAITPVVVATDRNNTIDSILIFTLLLAAWAWIKATESARLRYLLLGAMLVGIGFNIKMLQAYLPLPAFFALYFLGAKEKIIKKIFKLVLAGIVVLIVSLSWVTIVDLTPASQRPYVGSSSDNSEWSLAIGYNGLARLFGMGRNALTSNSRIGIPGGVNNAPRPVNPDGFNSNDGGFAQPNPADGGGIRGGAGGGMNEYGPAGILRLVFGPLSKEASWLLPMALFGLILLAVGKYSWPLNPRLQAAVLWGGWFITAGIFFSMASFFHQYYLSMLGAPLAALTGIGIMELWHIYKRKPWLGLGLLAVVVGLTLALQFTIAHTVMTTIAWQPWEWVVFGLGLAVAIGAILLKKQPLAQAGFCLVTAVMLMTPGLWSVLTMLYPSVNQSLPAAYDGVTRELVNNGGLQVDQSLLDFLQANTQGVQYLMAVPSSMQGADYVIATGRPVLYMGGFMGSDAVVNAEGLQTLVESGRLRYIFYNSGGENNRGQNSLTSWLQSHCQVVNGFDTLTVNMGNPDGTGGAPGGMGSAGGPGVVGRGSTQISLFDCAK